MSGWADTRYHPEGRCAFCGAPIAEAELRQTFLHSTHARGWRCVDDFECIRRLLAERTAA
jgi:hypothetical protein